ncbi:MAG: penicillin-binding transpeptidase domain-containing protein, partial [Bacillota bacterium]
MRLPSIEMRKRVLHGLAVFMVIYLALMFRVAWIQVVQGEELSEAALQSRTREISVQARRGIIMDREGRELAVSVDVDSLYAVPAEVRDVGEWAVALAPILDMDERVLRDRLSKSASFVWIKRKLSPEAAAGVRELDLSGLYFTMESERFYPKGTLASHVLGFAGVDSQGLEGVENSWDQVLRGEPGTISMEFDAEGREIPQAVYHYVPPVEGDNLHLSIDEIIQYIAERELAAVVDETGALGAHLVMMDPATGHILAMASYPNFDLNRWSEVAPALWRNPVVSDTQHPGSVFKPVTGAAALEEGVVTPATPFYDPGYVRVPGAVIHNWNRQGLGAADFALGFAKSANVIFVKTGLELGIEPFYKYLRAFGLDSPTGVDLPGEAEGIHPPEERARPVDLAVMSFGQTLTVTPLQMITATSAIINGGYLMRPQIAHSIEDSVTGEVRQVEPEVVRQVISAQTSATVRELMVQVIEEGTGSLAAIPGYSVGGKTGTAQKTVGGVVSTDRHVASFMGFAPATDPAVVCYVVIDEPQGI